jgi:hypothetical protein
VIKSHANDAKMAHKSIKRTRTWPRDECYLPFVQRHLFCLSVSEVIHRNAPLSRWPFTSHTPKNQRTRMWFSSMHTAYKRSYVDADSRRNNHLQTRRKNATSFVAPSELTPECKKSASVTNAQWLALIDAGVYVNSVYVCMLTACMSIRYVHVPFVVRIHVTSLSVHERMLAEHVPLTTYHETDWTAFAYESKACTMFAYTSRSLNVFGHVSKTFNMFAHTSISLTMSAHTSISLTMSAHTSISLTMFACISRSFNILIKKVIQYICFHKSTTSAVFADFSRFSNHLCSHIPFTARVCNSTQTLD